MKARQVTAILLSAIMTVSASTPVSSITALAAENSAAGETVSVEAAELVEPAEDETVGQGDGMISEPDLESEAHNTDVSEDESVAPDSAEAVEEGNTAEETSAASTEESVVQQPEGESIAEKHEDKSDNLTEEEASKQDIEEEAEEKTTKAALFESDDIDFENAVEFNPGDTKEASVSVDSPYAVWKFIPSDSGRYRFYSNTDEKDTYGELYDSDYELISDNDDGGENHNFQVDYYFEEGSVYYLVARLYDTSDYAVFPVYLREVESNLLKAVPEGAASEDADYAFLSVDPQNSVTLRVIVTAKDESQLQYTWEKRTEDGSETIEGVNSAQYIIESPTGEDYVCYVSDQYGNEIKVTFYVGVENELQVSANEFRDISYANIYAAPYENTTLQVFVTAKDTSQLIYKWAKDQLVYDEEDDSWEWEEVPISNSTRTLSVPAETASYICRVSDQYQNEESCTFSVKVDNQLKAYPEGNTENNKTLSMSLTYGESYTLKVHVDAIDKSQIQYSWYKEALDNGSREQIDGEDSTELSITAEEPATYYCYVSDQYEGNTSGPGGGVREFAEFRISIDNQLNVYPMGNNPDINVKKIHVTPGEDVVLETEVTAKDMSGISYSWLKENQNVEEVNGSSLIVKGEDKVYCCQVRDRFENKAEAYFMLYTGDDIPSFNMKADSFNVYPEGAQIVYGERAKEVHLYPALGETINLKVITEGNADTDIEYRWGRGYGDYGAGGFDYDFKTIENEASDNYTVTVTGSAAYRCTVSEGEEAEEEYLYYYIHNERFSAYPEGANITNGIHNNFVKIIAEKGEALNLRVLTEQDNDGLSYKWCASSHTESFVRLLDSTTSSAQINADADTFYECLVTDENQNPQVVYFFIDVNDFLLSTDSGELLPDVDLTIHEGAYVEYEVPAKYGDQLTLKTLVSGNDQNGITYSWKKYYYKAGYHHYINLDKESDSINIIADQNIDYLCEVYDKHYNRRWLCYHIVVDNELYAYPDGAEEGDDGKKKSSITISTTPSTPCILETKVDAINKDGLTYKWLDQRGGAVTTKNIAKIQIAVEKNSEFQCVVTDRLGNTSTAAFRILTGVCEEHSWEAEYTVDKEATCTEEGSESIHCSVCGVSDESTTRAIPKKEHAYGDWTVTKEATCTEAGSKEKVCASCGKKVTEEIPAAGHQWNESYTVDVAPTYTEEGVESIHCSVCGEIQEGSERAVAKLRKPISMLTISGIVAKNYNGKAQTQAVVVMDGDTTLVDGTDYTVSYENNTNAGTAYMIIKGEGSYTGSVTKTFTIKKVANAITAKSFTRTYSTKAQAFALGVKVKNGTPTYKSNSKYVVVSKAGKVTVKAKFIGKATITITAPASKNYTATTKKITVTVNPTKTALSSVSSPSTGKMTVKWKKNAVGTGYQIQYSTSSKFTSPKSVTITKNSTVTRTIGGLAKGKKYYVRIRTYKTVGSAKFYSGWSAAKTVTVKK